MDFRELGRVVDAVETVGIDGGVCAEEKAADVSEDGSAARGDAILGDEVVKIAEGEVDALSGLKILGVLNK